jgi:hypothetical protein
MVEEANYILCIHYDLNILILVLSITIHYSLIIYGYYRTIADHEPRSAVC